MAKKEYEKKHPNITIQIKGFTIKNMFSPVLLEKYLKTTSTEVLSGKGADLFVLNESSLPVDRIVDKKAFVNLNDYINIDTSFDKYQYYINIIQNSKMNGGLYVLPARFFLIALFVDQDAISKTGVKIDDKHNWTWSQFVEVSKQLKQKGTLESEEALQPLKQMITEANTQVRSNDKIQAILSEELKSYFSGQKSAESVADIIQNRVMTYLNE
ncbi:extracellular solute-binding protein [Neobacillus sp.]|uniref:extracellular solute-binding protein n=1 Tax=Neobacillus sp. TaxID=2675273 RepID=UPI00289747F7|nr:extracellular solute-binding protein [Neobacillus sp.]